MKYDLHTHTTFSDGENTPEEMIEAAIKAGLDRYGISDHSYTFFDESYCMARGRYDEYMAHISELKKKYSDRINVLCGIELDYHSASLPEGFDYVIGSMHYLKCGDEYPPIDFDKEMFCRIARDYFNNDFYAMCENYFETLADYPNRYRIDIVGHLDLITKYNEGNCLFDEDHPRFVKAWQNTVLKLLPHVKTFEVNYGDYNRGRRSQPYLTEPMQKFVLEHGGIIIRSSDSHTDKTIGKFK